MQWDNRNMAQDINKIRTLEELKGQTLEELLYEVANNQETITITLDEGGACNDQSYCSSVEAPGRVGWPSARRMERCHLQSMNMFCSMPESL